MHLKGISLIHTPLSDLAEIIKTHLLRDADKSARGQLVKTTAYYFEHMNKLHVVQMSVLINVKDFFCFILFIYAAH